MREDVLYDVAIGKQTPKKAYQVLYQRKPKIKRAHFIKMNITIYEHLWVTLLLHILFFLPMPIGFAGFFLKRGLRKENDMSKKEIKTYIDMLKHKPIHLIVTNREVRLKIKTI